VNRMTRRRMIDLGICSSTRLDSDIEEYDHHLTIRPTTSVHNCIVVLYSRSMMGSIYFGIKLTQRRAPLNSLRR